MAEVVLENVSRVFPGGPAGVREVKAVDRLSLEVKDRELLVLVGPSGCGKTTTLRMIAGLEDVTTGEIRIGGRAVNRVPARDRNIAMVFQNHALYPHLSVYRNMAFALELRYGASWLAQAFCAVFWRRRAAQMAAQRYEIAEKVHGSAQTLGIEHLLERMPGQLSGGERQRVALGRAIVRQPAAFLFDEPLSNLDARLRVEMRREIKLLHQRLRTTMIYVTHDQVEALTLGERIAVIDRGVLQQIGTPREVYDQPKNQFVAGFLGTPPMNFIRGRLWSENGQARFGRGGWSIPLPTSAVERVQRYMEKGVVLGVRPENVSLTGASSGGEADLAARVALVEPLGDATLLELVVEDPSHNSEKFNVHSKIGPRAELAPGHSVSVRVDRERVHLFDPETGESLLAADN